MSYGHVVLANSKTGFVAQSIKKFTKSEFSHSLVTTPNVLNVPMCIEAAEGGVDFTRFDVSYIHNPSQGYEIWNIKIDQSIKDTAIISILSDLEIAYGFLQYPYFMWRRLCLLFGKDIKSKSNWFAQGMICSQLCVAYLNACGLGKIFIGYGKGSIAPQDLQDIFKAHPELFELIEKRE